MRSTSATPAWTAGVKPIDGAVRATRHRRAECGCELGRLGRMGREELSRPSTPRPGQVAGRHHINTSPACHTIKPVVRRCIRGRHFSNWFFFRGSISPSARGRVIKAGLALQRGTSGLPGTTSKLGVSTLPTRGGGAGEFGDSGSTRMHPWLPAHRSPPDGTRRGRVCADASPDQPERTSTSSRPEHWDDSRWRRGSACIESCMGLWPAMGRHGDRRPDPADKAI